MKAKHLEADFEIRLTDSIMRSIQPLFLGKIKTLRAGNRTQVLGLIEWFRHGPRGGHGLELGSYCGESALIFINLGAKGVTCVDAWDDAVGWNRLLESLDKAEMFFDHVRDIHPSQITKAKGRTDQVLRQMAASGLGFDWIYIDASHRYKDVVNDIELSLPLLRADGWIGGHDYRKGNSVVRAVDNTLGVPEKVFRDGSWIMRI